MSQQEKASTLKQEIASTRVMLYSRLSLLDEAMVMFFPVSTTSRLKEARSDIEKSRNWLGKVKGYLGEAHPYPPKQDPSAIPPETDTVRMSGSKYMPDDYLEFLNEIREDLKVACNRIENIRRLAKEELYGCEMERSDEVINLQTAITNAWTHICEARFPLGYEIGLLRDNELTSN